MTEAWTAELVGKMHLNRIRQIDLAKHMGVTRSYVSMILTGTRTAKNAERQFKQAVDELIEKNGKAGG